MLGALLLVILLYLISLPILGYFKSKFPYLNLRRMRELFWYHYLFAIFYYLYALSSASDSEAYFTRTLNTYRIWFDAFEPGTKFIDFVGYPFVNYMGFSYEMIMALFAWFGYWGFVYFYIFFKENTRFKHTVRGVDLIDILIFLPNMHFWNVSFGKGSLIFFGLGIAAYSISKINIRKLMFGFGMTVIYFVRPHVFLFVGFGTLVGLFTGRENVPLYQKILVILSSSIAIFLLYDQILSYANLDSENLIDSFESFSSSRSGELLKATSGVDISNYPVVLKLLTFWYRPLFFDAPGLLGLIVSFENLFYVYLTFRLLQTGFWSFFRKSRALVKASVVIFLSTSFALSSTLSNLGIIIRQKSMVMYFFFFLILAFLDYKRAEQQARKKAIEERKARLQPAS